VDGGGGSSSSSNISSCSDFLVDLLFLMDRTRGTDVVAATASEGVLLRLLKLLLLSFMLTLLYDPFEGELFDIEGLLMVESAIGFLMLL
jgi:hypothetical protein